MRSRTAYFRSTLSTAVLALFLGAHAPLSLAQSDCSSCSDPYREYSIEPDAHVQALFAAATQADETRFAQLLDGLEDIDALAIDTRSLTAAILSLDPRSLEAFARSERQEKAIEELKARHRASLPARARMLKRALAAGASVSDIGYYSRMPPLHLAMVFGNADIVQILLDHGADPAQQDGDEGNMPIEFALDHAFFLRRQGLPELVEPAERTRMLLALMRAGAPRPWSRLDAAFAREIGDDSRPAADYALWPRLAALTAGAEIMQAMADSGTLPANTAESVSALAHAVRAGNLGGAQWLLAHAPRYAAPDSYAQGSDRAGLDTWADAAMWAIHEPDAQLRTALLDALLHTDLDWNWNGPLLEDADTGNAPVRAHWQAIPRDQTLLGHAIHAGDAALVERLIALGAPTNPDDDTREHPLTVAVRAGKPEIVALLLRHGSDPLASNYAEVTPLTAAVLPRYSDWPQDPAQRQRWLEASHQSLALILDALGPDKIQALNTADDASHTSSGTNHPLTAALRSPDPVVVEMLLNAGLDASRAKPVSFGKVFTDLPTSLALRLIEEGLPLETSDAGAFLHSSALIAALLAPEPAPLVAALLERGVDPNARDELDRTALSVAIRYHDMALVRQLLEAGADVTALDYRDTLAALAADDHQQELRDWVLQNAPSDLSQYCPSRDAAAGNVMAWLLSQSDAAWQRMRAAGLARDNAACQAHGTTWRALALEGVTRLGFPPAGWMAETLTARIATLPTSESDPVIAPNELLPEIAALFGVKPDATPLVEIPGRIDSARAGNYLLVGVHEAASALRLNADGSFEYALTYGALDQYAKGQWRVQDNRLLLRGDYAPPSQQPPGTLRAEDTADDATAALDVSVKLGRQDVEDVMIAVYGNPGEMAHDFGKVHDKWFSGPVRHIAVHLRGISGGLIAVFEPGAAEQLRRKFVVELDQQKLLSQFEAENPFFMEMTLEENELVLPDNSRYRRQ